MRLRAFHVPFEARVNAGIRRVFLWRPLCTRDALKSCGVVDSCGKSASAEGGWSEWQDLNLRPPRPERGALPDCATLRLKAGLIAATFPCCKLGLTSRRGW